ncbi:putative SnoaL-like aldol condensation-catalyzing enzyme [Herbihabitans rhizosphaerae]|uniref:Putative SnoaL-like aldol condensation-catalyzing enzyme n=1 Tax=Herbihabitans rhizosphaerae TaxID=1872711 RepID=A0A4Q7KC65_9PSEU|nr:nuclear transport factor 2 family protein [Herbihabitans rhizosphaerae]RZS30587.1 putative SnoaL-like aldol condensation-catalyzing enzyme [Herbihabitans rhizosphaerae]
MNDNERAERNRELVLHCFAEVDKGNLEPLRALLHKDFLEHGPGNPSGRDAFVQFIADSGMTEARLDMKRAIADHDHVVVHYNLVPPGEERGMAVVDILRFVDDKIVEHWDVVQPVPEPDQVPHGMF